MSGKGRCLPHFNSKGGRQDRTAWILYKSLIDGMGNCHNVLYGVKNALNNYGGYHELEQAKG